MLTPSEIGRPFIGPPGVPHDRVIALRQAFNESLRDPDLIKAAEAQRLDISPVSGYDMESLIAHAYQSSPEVVARARVLAMTEGGR